MKKLTFNWVTATIGVTAAVATVVTIVSCGSSDALVVTQGTVIQNATVVNTSDGSLQPGMAVIIDQGKIQNITATTVRVSGTAQAVDGTGQFVVPGFNDMHVHTLASVVTTNGVPSSYYWPLFIANGITGIREMNGSAALVQLAHQVNAAGAAGQIDAPQILQMAGDIWGLGGGTLTATQFVDQEKQIGADFVKVVAGNNADLTAILAEAKVQGMTVAGHLAPALSATDASNLGWKAIEHLGASVGGIGLDCSDAEPGLRPALTAAAATPIALPPTFVMDPLLYIGVPSAPGMQAIQGSYDPVKCQALMQVFIKNGTWHVPTLIRLRTMENSNATMFTSDPNLQYVDKTTQALWQQLGQQYTATVPAVDATILTQFYPLHLTLTNLLQTSGVNMMAGTDVGGIWVIPGFSLHQEFKELASAGLSPLKILQMTTLTPAQFLNQQATMGSVAVGKNANLVLLGADPTQNVANLDNIRGVFLKGKYFSSAALAQLKSNVAAAQASAPIKDLSTAIDPYHKD